MTDAAATCGEAPLDIEMGAGYAAGAAFQAALIGHTDVIFLQFVNIGGTEIETGLLLATVMQVSPSTMRIWGSSSTLNRSRKSLSSILIVIEHSSIRPTGVLEAVEETSLS